MRILIVDDDESRSAGLADYLLKQSIAVPGDMDRASCTDVAKALMRAKYYDAIVLDVVLPKRVGERPSSSFGLQLLDQIGREAFIKKPEKVIGLTAHIEDLNAYRDAFEDVCAVVIEASGPSDSWRAKIASALAYTSSSQISRFATNQEIVIFTVHGIRTYGGWQSKLKSLVETHTDKVSFHSYQYGYFSTLSFLIPYVRDIEVSRLIQRVQPYLHDVGDRTTYIFCHSFGTYLVVNALRKMFTASESSPTVCLVLCGSVLPSNFNWEFVRKSQNFRVVNDCGTNDYVLWLSNAAALGLGMAGKCGFHGFNDDRFSNRFFRGGHSLYFDATGEFMRTYWLPLLTDANYLSPHDDREAIGRIHGGLEGVVRFLGRCKVVAYVALGLAVSWLLAGLLTGFLW